MSRTIQTLSLAFTLLLAFLFILPVFAESDTEIITDIANWNHPTKTVFSNEGVIVMELELTKDKKYLTFIVKLPSPSELEDQLCFDAMLESLVHANGYWDFKVIDPSRDFSVEVSSNRSLKKITQVVYSGHNNYFKKTARIHRWDLPVVIHSYFGVIPDPYQVVLDRIHKIDEERYYLLHGFNPRGDKSESSAWDQLFLLHIDYGELYIYNKAANELSAFNLDNLPYPVTYSEERIIKPVTREDSGLSLLERKGLGALVLNQQIHQIVFQDKTYSNSDYSLGLVESGGILISERFTDTIIDDIRIGTPLESVRDILGEPSVQKDSQLFYKTAYFYLGFQGETNVEHAMIIPHPNDYSRDILKRILLKLEISDLEALTQDPEIADFLTGGGFIHGGGWYHQSDNGVEVIWFDENTVTVYNNFEGDLYQYISSASRYKIIFEDHDMIIENMSFSLKNHVQTNTRFDKDGLLSPSGKLKIIFDWIHSDCYYFTIRTLDNSRPDYFISARANDDFHWINDNYIIFIDRWYNIPYIISVSDKESSKIYNVLQEISIIASEEEIHSIEPMSFTVISITEEFITLKDKNNNNTYTIRYDFTQNGSINLALLPQDKKIAP